jgi:triacylglycerol lipase
VTRRAEVILIAVLAVVCAAAGWTLAARHRNAATSGQAATPAGLAPSPRPAPPPRPTPPPPPPPTVVNSESCKPPPQHPDPVVLVPGTFALTSWDLIGPSLAQRGYCVFAINYGAGGTKDIVGSAHQLAGDVDHILAVTGAHQVAIVGHSEGGMMARYYVKELGAAAKVSDLIGLAPSNHGTANPLTLVGALAGCVACGQQLMQGSPLLQRLNAGNEAPPPVDYTVIQTRYDTVVVPYQSAFLRGPRARVTNVTLQDACPADAVDHLGLPTDPVALQWVEEALAVNGPADPAFRPAC